MKKSATIQNTEWLTPKQLEIEFGISVQSQYKMRLCKNYEKEAMQKQKPIPFVKIAGSGRILYNRAKINEWLLTSQIGV
ncbi:MAG: hypothetical protein MR902_01290 [Campylobacter sp.]|nr:hypothetical protein [Campylobacter sp.]